MPLEKLIEKKANDQGYSSVNEYKDMLKYMDIDPGTKSIFDIQKDIPEMLKSIHTRYGSPIYMNRLMYLLMKIYSISQSGARSIIRCAKNDNLITIDDKFMVEII